MAVPFEFEAVVVRTFDVGRMYIAMIVVLA